MLDPQKTQTFIRGQASPECVLVFYVVLVFAHHLVGEDPRGDDSEDKKGDNN
ncbi:MAG: hypothetical protein AB7O48_10440 [Cyclobacteriaceae bacterium]